MRFLLFSALLFCAGFLQAQQISGIVSDDKQSPLSGAIISWKNTNTHALSDSAGRFIIEADSLPQYLVVTYVGYDPVELEVLPGETSLEIEISGIIQLDAVEVKGKRSDTYVSTINPLNTEHISGAEFRKAACCSLAESFETNGSADVTMSDALSGAKEIQMLGLRGLYTQLLQENRPALNGLATPFALDFIPGTWLESIQISKGASSVLTGSAALSGMINYELVKPATDKPVFVNVFGNTNGRFETNVHLNKKLDDHWSAGLLMHYSVFQHVIDRDDDTFMDSPLKEQWNGMFRLQFKNPKWMGHFNYQALTDHHDGGQGRHNEVDPSAGFATHRRFNRHEVSGKVGYTGFSCASESTGLSYSLTLNDVDARYGHNLHQGKERSLYLNYLYSNIIASDPDHKFTAGATFLWDQYRERLNEYDLDRTDRIAGVYGEYNYCHDGERTNFLQKAGLMAGMRLEYHPVYGWLPSPRMNGKYNFSDESILRFSAGRGFRIPNLVSDNISGLISNKPVLIGDDLTIEKAWNYGLNFTQSFYMGSRRLQFTSDLYRTDFQDQVVMDMDSDPSQVQFYNLRGRSFSNSFMASLQVPVFRLLDIKIVYKWNEAKVTFGDELLLRPMLARHRGLVTFDFHTPNEKWQWNTHFQLVGTQRLPDHSGVPSEYLQNHADEAPAYLVVNTQLTFKGKKMEWYGGIENLGDYRQKFPVIAWQDPQSPYLDATQVYGPTLGIRGYAGVRASF